MREAIHQCGAHRIGHATRLIEDESLTQYVNDRRIALEICLTSNVQTRAVESYEAHPLRRYFDRGMNVVLNTDNRLMSGTTLTDEYLHAARSLDFTFDELARDRAKRIRERVPAVGGAFEAPRRIRRRAGAAPVGRGGVSAPSHGADEALAAAEVIRDRVGDLSPVAAIVLGSGLGRLADEIESAIGDRLSRRSRLSRGDGRRACRDADRGLARAECRSSRWRDAFTCTRGTTPRSPAYPVRVVHALGARTLIVSNAAGGVNRQFRARAT